MKRCFFILTALALMPFSLQARFQDRAAQEDKRQPDKKTLRVFIEGKPSAIPTVIEQLRRTAHEQGLGLTFVSQLTDAPDARIIVVLGTGKTWDTSLNTHPGDIRFPVPFAFSSAAVLTHEGRMLFTVAESSNTPKSANIALARALIKNLHDHYGALKKKQDAPNKGETGAQKPAAAEATITTGNATEEPPAEPGVYYKAQTGWVRLEEASAAEVKTKGMKTTMLTQGISATRIAEVYPGAQAQLRISEGKPTFYVRGFAVSDKDAVIVRLEKKSDHREVAVASVSAFNAKAGYTERDICKVKIARASSDLTVITPESELDPGEYLLSLATLESGYDFQIAAR
jgi:hypothetical protein